MGDWLQGMISGYSGRRDEHQAEQLRLAEQQNQRESRIYEALINSPDPEVKSAAITGLLTSTQAPKKKKGFAGWMGEMEGNPAYQHIQDLIKTPVTSTTEEPATFGLGSRQSIGVSDLPPGGARAPGALALPDTSPTQVGAPPPPPMTPVSTPEPQAQFGAAAGAPPAVPLTPAGSQVSGYAAAPVTSTRTVTTTKPRQIFRTPEEQTLLTKKASAQGDVEGEVAGLIASGYSDVEARNLVKAKYERLTRGGVGAAPFQAIAGTMPDGTATSAVFDKAHGHYIHPVTGDVLEGFVARNTAASAPRFGQDRESIAESEFHNTYGNLTQPQQQIVQQKLQEFLKTSAGSRVAGAGEAKMDVPLDARTAQLTGMPVGSTSRQVAGQQVSPVAQQVRLQTAGNIKTQLASIKDLLGPLPKANTIGAVAPGWAIAASRAKPANRVAWANLTSAINNIRASLTRTMQANVGTETEKDAERALTTIADIEGSLLNPLKGDTQESANARIDQTLAYLDQVMSSIPGTPTIGAPPPKPTTPAPAAAAPSARPAARAAAPVSGAGPSGYTVNDQGELLLNGQPAP